VPRRNILFSPLRRRAGERHASARRPGFGRASGLARLRARQSTRAGRASRRHSRYRLRRDRAGAHVVRHRWPPRHTIGPCCEPVRSGVHIAVGPWSLPIVRDAISQHCIARAGAGDRRETARSPRVRGAHSLAPLIVNQGGEAVRAASCCASLLNAVRGRHAVTCRAPALHALALASAVLARAVRAVSTASSRISYARSTARDTRCATSAAFSEQALRCRTQSRCQWSSRYTCHPYRWLRSRADALSRRAGGN